MAAKKRSPQPKEPEPEYPRIDGAFHLRQPPPYRPSFAPTAAWGIGAFEPALGSALYSPPAATIPALGRALTRIRAGARLPVSYIGGKVVILFPGLEDRHAIFFESVLELDLDGSRFANGWPNAKGTSLKGDDGNALDSDAVPYFVLPLPTRAWTSLGVDLGDVAAVLHDNRVAFAIFGDYGPKNKLGEASLQLHRDLGYERVAKGEVNEAHVGTAETITAYRHPTDSDGKPKEEWKLDRNVKTYGGGVLTIVFPGSRALVQNRTKAGIERACRPLFERLGGVTTRS
ncbi:MAG: hypothetical protein HOW73_14180 [Polyangiaceae bacterium]|nr:hypothetical protein [Polyangiaceae bacterium]